MTLRHFLIPITLVAAIAVAWGAPQAGAQTGTAQGEKVAPPAKPEDVATPQAIVGALYDVISGPAGQKRDWDRFHSLFAPEAKMIPIGRRSPTSVAKRVFTPDDYVSMSGKAIEDRGFFEKEVASKMELFGDIAHVWSTYETRALATDEKAFMRGINSIQLQFDGKRWWILSIIWEAEGPELKLPSKYLPGGG